MTKLSLFVLPIATILWTFSTLPMMSPNFLVNAATVQSPQMVDRLNQEANRYYDQGQLKEALVGFQQVLKLYREAGDRAGEAEVLYNIGKVYDLLRQPAEGQEVLQQALKIRQQLGDRIGEAETLALLGRTYDRAGFQAQALETLQKALTVQQQPANTPSERLRQRKTEGRVKSDLGALLNTSFYGPDKSDYMNSQVVQQSLELLQQSVDIHREVGDRLKEGQSLTLLGSAYVTLKQPQRATDLLQSALKVYESFLATSWQQGNRFNEARTLELTGYAYYWIGLNTNQAAEQALQSVKYLQQATTLYRELGYRIAEGETLESIAEIGCAQKPDPFECEVEHYQNVLAIFQRSGDAYHVAKTNTAIAHL